MSDPTSPEIGAVCWQDLTVPDAAAVRDFYSAVLGWKAEPFEGDFNMVPAGGTAPAAGICYARGPNAELPPVWLIYVRVLSVAESAAEAQRRGGSIVDGPRTAGGGTMCVIRDPAGATMALFQTAT